MSWLRCAALPHSPDHCVTLTELFDWDGDTETLFKDTAPARDFELLRLHRLYSKRAIVEARIDEEDMGEVVERRHLDLSNDDDELFYYPDDTGDGGSDVRVPVAVMQVYAPPGIPVLLNGSYEQAIPPNDYYFDPTLWSLYSPRLLPQPKAAKPAPSAPQLHERLLKPAGAPNRRRAFADASQPGPQARSAAVALKMRRKVVEWLVEEDWILLRATRRLTIGEWVNWSLVSEFVNGRTHMGAHRRSPESCLERYDRLRLTPDLASMADRARHIEPLAQLALVGPSRCYWAQREILFQRMLRVAEQRVASAAATSAPVARAVHASQVQAIRAAGLLVDSHPSPLIVMQRATERTAKATLTTVSTPGPSNVDASGAFNSAAIASAAVFGAASGGASPQTVSPLQRYPTLPNMQKTIRLLQMLAEARMKAPNASAAAPLGGGYALHSGNAGSRAAHASARAMAAGSASVLQVPNAAANGGRPVDLEKASEGMVSNAASPRRKSGPRLNVIVDAPVVTMSSADGVTSHVPVAKRKRASSGAGGSGAKRRPRTDPTQAAAVLPGATGNPATTMPTPEGAQAPPSMHGVTAGTTTTTAAAAAAVPSVPSAPARRRSSGHAQKTIRGSMKHAGAGGSGDALVAHGSDSGAIAEFTPTSDERQAIARIARSLQEEVAKSTSDISEASQSGQLSGWSNYRAAEPAHPLMRPPSFPGGVALATTSATPPPRFKHEADPMPPMQAPMREQPNPLGAYSAVARQPATELRYPLPEAMIPGRKMQMSAEINPHGSAPSGYPSNPAQRAYMSLAASASLQRSRQQQQQQHLRQQLQQAQQLKQQQPGAMSIPARGTHQQAMPPRAQAPSPAGGVYDVSRNPMMTVDQQQGQAWAPRPFASTPLQRPQMPPPAAPTYASPLREVPSPPPPPPPPPQPRP